MTNLYFNNSLVDQFSDLADFVLDQSPIYSLVYGWDLIRRSSLIATFSDLIMDNLLRLLVFLSLASFSIQEAIFIIG